MELNSIDLFGDDVTSFNVFPHQYDGIRYLQYIESQLLNPKEFKGAILGDSMGLGKTRQIIGLCEVCRVPLTLIVSTTSTQYAWYREALNTAQNCNIFTSDNKGFKTITYNDDLIEIGKNSILNPNSPKKSGIVIITTGQLGVKQNLDFLFKFEWDRICVDEGHLLRNGTKLNIYGILDSIPQPNQNGNRIGSRFAITGTPISNETNDIMNIFRWIDLNNIINDKNQMIKKYLFRRNGDQIIPGLKKIMNYPNEEPLFHYKEINIPDTKLSQYLQGLTNSQMKEAFVNYHNQILNDEKAFYIVFSNFVHYSDKEILAKKTCFHVALSCPYLDENNNNLINGYSYNGEKSSKTDKILEILGEYPDNYVIFYNFKGISDHLTKKIKSKLSQYTISIINGDTTTKDRDNILIQNKKLIESGGKSILFSSIKATSEGLNYQIYNKLMILDQDWNPQQENQAIHRVYRIGQKKRVEIYRFSVQPFIAGKDENGEDIIIAIDQRIEEIKSIKNPLAKVIENENASFFFKRLYLPMNGKIQPATYYGDEFEFRARGSYDGPDSIGPELLETYPL